ncbi:MAG: transglutaminase-like cysteine peptidase [Hyphomicrobiaceae bacterium]|nr:transglutaminase-like cysteine peptidase [Hyphomicrobiaceae bacterium]
MSAFNTFRRAFGFVVLALVGHTAHAHAAGIDFTNPAFIAPAGETSIPVGHAEFCAAHRSECQMNSSVTSAVALDQSRWQQLLEVNAEWNSKIIPVTDEQLYHVAEFWTYPHGYGDCEDFALAKRRELIDLGWPASTLLMTVVRQANGEGHAVLMVRTDRGDLILDNQDGLVKVWNQTRYQFIKRQSQNNAGQWVALVDTRPMNLIASL